MQHTFDRERYAVDVEAWQVETDCVAIRVSFNIEPGLWRRWAALEKRRRGCR